MVRPRKAPKTTALLVAAIKKLKSIHGSTSREITNYIASECEGSTKNIKRQMKLALRRGVSAGILNRSKNGYYTCAGEDLEIPAGDRSRGCRKKRRRRRRCGRSRSRRRSRKRRCGRRRRSRRRRRRRGKKCGKKRRARSRCRRRRRRCGGRRRDDNAEVDELVDDSRRSAALRRNKPLKKRAKNTSKNKNNSKTSSQTRISSASSTDTQRSGAETGSVTLSASGKDSLTDQSDISGNSDVNSGETKP